MRLALLQDRMPQWHLTRLIVIFSGLFLTCLVSFIVAAAGPETAYIGLVRIFDVDDIGAQQSFGLAHSSSEDLFIVIDDLVLDLFRQRDVLHPDHFLDLKAKRLAVFEQQGDAFADLGYRSALDNL